MDKSFSTQPAVTIKTEAEVQARHSADREANAGRAVREINQKAIRLETYLPHCDSNFTVMDAMLKHLKGECCDIYMKNGSKILGPILLGYDRNYLLLRGSFESGVWEPYVKDICLLRSDVSIIMEHVPQPYDYKNTSEYKDFGGPITDWSLADGLR